MDALKDKRVELVLGQLEELPTLPAVAIKVLEATGRDDASAKGVVSLISSDPALSTRILRLVHRADSGVRSDVTSIERAVVLLGFEAVRSAVLAVSVFQTFASQASSAQPAPADKEGAKTRGSFSREAFWTHSIAVASCAELLARQLSASWGKDARIEPSEAFLCGLLHDVGKLALDAALPKSFAKVIEASELLRGNIADVERQIVGIDHMVVGKRLAEKWKLPNTIRDCAWLHGQLPSALPSTMGKTAGGSGTGAGSTNGANGVSGSGGGGRLVNLITLADSIVREHHLGYSGNYTFPIPRKVLLEAVGLTEAQVARSIEELVETIEVRAEALGLHQVSSGELYQQALAQANRELGRVSTQLAAKNKRLAVRAKFFDALAEFHGQLSPDAAPTVVLRAIAETAREALGVSVAAAFSIPPGRGYAEIVVSDASMPDDPETLLTDVGDRPPWGHVAGSVVATDVSLETITRMVHPKMQGVRLFWTGLMAEGECVGGLIWGSGGGGGGGAPTTETAGGEMERLGSMRTELAGLVGGWSLALRTSQIRDEARLLAEQLAEANRNLQDTQGELARTRTLVTVAEMAAGAAHEMNNPLAVISGRSQLLATILTEEKQKKSAQLIAEQADRLSGMITELMEFAKPSLPTVTECNVRQIVESAIEAAKARTPESKCTIDVQLTDVPTVHVDAKQASAALAEVLDNALQAVAQGAGASQGANSPVGAMVQVSAVHDPFGRNVVITVSDRGVGMDEQTLGRAFDPFFSMKPAGRRRGMGLSKAQRWIEGCGGSIRLESRLGSGTRAIVLLPVCGADDLDARSAGAVVAADTAVSRRVAG